MEEYLSIFIDKDYPYFLDKYNDTKTMKRIMHVTQYCGSDYTKIYDPRALFMRFNHSWVVAHITWHFTHDKKATIAALLHDTPMPCFAHAIDFAMGDYMNQESAEVDIVDILSRDPEILEMLASDGISLEDLEDLSRYPILENKSPKLCADRLDGVLHTTYIWLNRGSIEEVKEIYDDLIVLTNEDGKPEIGFKSLDVCLKFVKMVETYALELQGSRDKYVSEYVARVVKTAIDKGLIKLEDLYTMEEEELVSLFRKHFPSWTVFESAREVVSSDVKPECFYVSADVKKRNVIPLVRMVDEAIRVDKVSMVAKKIYDGIQEYQSGAYASVPGIADLKCTYEPSKPLMIDKV